jgi:two-component system response regulator MprA
VSKRVLVVDDDDAGLRLVGAILSDAGFDVDLRESGAAALELLGESRPDAMVVDLVMPRMDGFEFLLQARSIPNAKGVPVIVMTASRTVGDLTVGAFGVQAAVEKPFELDELVGLVSRVLAEEPEG